MATIGNLICLTPRDSYVVDEPVRRKGLLGRLERSIGPFFRSPGIGFPYLVGFLRKNGVLTDAALRSSDENIFACGDVANSFHPLLGRRIRVEH